MSWGLRKCSPIFVPTRIAAHKYANLSKLLNANILTWQWKSHNDKWTAYKGSLRFLHIYTIKFVTYYVSLSIPYDFESSYVGITKYFIFDL